MSNFRKIISRSSIYSTKLNKIAPNKFAVTNIKTFSTLLENKRGEEAKYIRNLEAQRQADMRANIERILALEDDHEDKRELKELLGLYYLMII